MKIKISIFLVIFIIISSTCAFAGTSAEKLYNQANKFYLKENYSSAFSRCQSILTKHRRSSLKDDANYLAGLCLLKLGRYSDARKYFNNVINQKPKSPLKEDARLSLTDIYLLEKNLTKAQKPKKSLKKPDYYTVQLGSFTKRSNASRLYRKFKKRGYSAYIIDSKENGKRLYKVRIGKFKSSSKARAFASKLKREGYRPQITEW